MACMNGREHNVKLLLEQQKKLLEKVDEEEKKKVEEGEEKEEEDGEEEDDEMDIEMQRKSFDLVNTESQSHDTPAHFAVKSGNAKILEMLIDAKANLNTFNTKKWTPLMAASAYGQLECVKILVEKGKCDPLQKNKQNKHALIYAIINGHIDIVSYLLRLGVHPDLYFKKFIN